MSTDNYMSEDNSGMLDTSPIKQMTVKEVLIAARAKIDTPDKWTTRLFARDINDNDAEITSPEACKFCILGAIKRVLEVDDIYRLDTKTPDIIKLDLFYSSRAALKAKITVPVTEYNDSATHEQVIALIDETIGDMPQ